MTKRESTDQAAIDRLNARSPKAAPYLSGGSAAYEILLDCALGCVSEIAGHVDRPELAEQARRTLDDLCASVDGYPEPVRAALQAAGLVSVPRIAQR